MSIDIKTDCTGVDWDDVVNILKVVGMSHHSPELHKKAFENSMVKIFLFNSGKLIGFGRALTDGAYEAGVYDVAVLPEFQGKGLGRVILESLLERLPQCNFILYAAPGKEDFYRKVGLRKMKTGMARFVNTERMAQRGFTD